MTKGQHGLTRRPDAGSFRFSQRMSPNVSLRKRKLVKRGRPRRPDKSSPARPTLTLPFSSSFLVRPRPGDTQTHADAQTQTQTDTRTHSAASDSGSLTGAEVSEPSIGCHSVGWDDYPKPEQQTRAPRKKSRCATI